LVFFKNMNKKFPQISVVMPVYNAEKYVKMAIESVLNQTYKNFEFIIINDQSTDSTLKIINSFKDFRIKVINTNKNIGVAKALNIGLNFIKGKYIARMDADDICVINRFKILKKYLDSHLKVGVVGSWVSKINDIGNVIKEEQPITKFLEIQKQIIYHNPIVHSTVMFRSSLIVKYGTYDERLNGAEDWDLWLRYAKFTEIVNLPQILLKYRNNQDSISNKRIKKIEVANILLLAKAFTKYKYPIRHSWYILKTIISFIIPSIIKEIFLKNFNKIEFFLKRLIIICIKKTEYLSSLSLHLVKFTKKHSDAIHPKHLISIREPFYLKYFKSKDIVLDIGCHNGQRTIKAAGRCKEIIGIDKDEKGLVLASKEAKRKNVKNIKFIECDVLKKLPFNKNYFDNIIFLDVLEHLVKRKKILNEINRVLKKNGKLFLSVPNSNTSWKKLQKKFNIQYFSDPDHKIEYSKNEIIEILKVSKYQLITIFPSVLDTPYVGFIDLIGGISINFYKMLVKWRRKEALRNPDESVGWEIYCKKII
jgi:glycosyltransferase involved in cell wall biosynthesis/precorrin-6B methylase 2